MITYAPPQTDKQPAVITTEASQPVLPEPSPMQMPDQDLAISPVVGKIMNCLRWPGALLRSILSAKRLRSEKGGT